MNWPKFFIAFIAAFVFLFVFGFLWYATLMHGVHREVPTLLRPDADLKSYFGWIILGHIVMAFFFTLLCSERRCRRRCNSGNVGWVGVRGPTFDLIRGPTVDSQTSLRMDRRRRDSIRDCRRNRRRNIQTRSFQHHVCEGAVALIRFTQVFRFFHRVQLGVGH
jgi:hypothetical protein